MPWAFSSLLHYRWGRAVVGGLALLLLGGTARTSTTTLVQSAAASSLPVSGDEFVGPFVSWTNLKTVYGAVGDGTADDTSAIQNALTELGTEGHPPVLFIPAGRYRITKTLTLEHTNSVGIVGDDASTVSVVWDGPAGGTMLRLNGVAYSRFSRLTYDGQRKASVAIEQSWDGLKQPFDTGNEYSDHAFFDVEYGIHGGFNGHGFAETSIIRSRFIRNTKAGIALGNFNALDIWIWYSAFEDCAMGVTNEPGAGNFRVYGSTFRRSSIADLYMKNTGLFSARGNYSMNSKAFFLSAGPLAHPANIELQGNTIMDSLEATTIRFGNQGPGLLLDNVVKSSPDAKAPIVVWRSFTNADVASVGNTFTVPDPVSVSGRLIAVDDRVVPAASLTPQVPQLPVSAPNLKRPIVEVERNADSVVIQRAINRAAQQIGARPVVHIPFGSYAVSQTLTIPPGDLQLVGDGPRTILRWTGTSRGPVLRISGPTKTTIRELQVDGARNADAVVVEGIDQPGSRVYLEGIQLWTGSEVNLLVNRLRDAVVDLRDIGHANATATSIKVLGSKVTFFSASSSSNALSYDVSDGARVVVRDTWYENGASRGSLISVRDQARLTFENSRVATIADTPAAAVTIENLTGRVAMLSNHIDDRIAIAGNGANAALFGLGTLREFHESPYFENRTFPPATVLMVNARQRARVQGRLSPGTLQIPDSGRITQPFIREMLSDTRTDVLPVPLTASPGGVSDVRMFRVWASAGLSNLILRP